MEEPKILVILKMYVIIAPHVKYIIGKNLVLLKSMQAFQLVLVGLVLNHAYIPHI